MFTNAGFEAVSFGSEITEAAFMPSQSYLEWVDASYDLKEEFKKVYYENENKIKFARYADIKLYKWYQIAQCTTVTQDSMLTVIQQF